MSGVTVCWRESAVTLSTPGERFIAIGGFGSRTYRFVLRYDVPDVSLIECDSLGAEMLAVKAQETHMLREAGSTASGVRWYSCDRCMRLGPAHEFGWRECLT